MTLISTTRILRRASMTLESLISHTWTRWGDTGTPRAPRALSVRGARVVQVCVSNITAITYTGSFSAAERWCECEVRSEIPLRLTLVVPEANPVWERGLNGTGQLVAFADTGLDTGSCLASEAGPTGVARLPPDLLLGRGADAQAVRRGVDMGRRKVPPPQEASCGFTFSLSRPASGLT
jgi:hypothetical protein